MTLLNVQQTVEIEIRAAEIAQLSDVSHGTTAHEFAGWCELQNEQHFIDQTATSCRQWWAGWLARQIHGDCRPTIDRKRPRVKAP